jgi:hypothetical protein
MIKRTSRAKTFSWLAMVFIPFMIGIYSIILGQDINWDLQNYHLYNPYAYLHGRIDFDLSPAGLQTYFNPFLDLVYFSAIGVLDPKSVAFLIGVIQGFSFVIIFKIAKQILGAGCEGYAIILGIAGLLSVGFLSEVGTTLHDSLVGVLTLTALWLTMLAIGYIGSDQRKSVGLLGMSGVLVGIACGLKLVFAIYALALFLGLFFVPLSWSLRFKLALLFGVSASAGLLLTGGYWFYKMWSEFGNPLFPQFNNIFHGELASFEPIRDARFLPINLYEKLFYPAVFTNNPLRVGELRYEQVSWIFGYVALLALGGAGLFRSSKTEQDRRLSPQVMFLVVYFGISYVLWLNIFGIYRYLIPIEVLIPLLIFIAVDYFLKPSVPRWTVAVFLSMITLVNLKGVPDWGRSNWSDTVYRVDSSAITDYPEPAAVYLVGQPLAWIIPALEINTPFIQLAPNMPVTDAYWKQARAVTDGRVGKQFAIFASPSTDLLVRANVGLVKLRLVLDESTCDRLVGYLGSVRYDYRFCELKGLEE